MRTALPTAPLQQHPELASQCGRLRVTGVLSEDARLELDMPAERHAAPRMLLRLNLRPPAEPGVPEGLPYRALVNLGTDPTDHLQAEALAPHLRAGALVSVAAQALQPCTDHGHFALRLVQPSAVLLLRPPIPAARGLSSSAPSSTTPEA